MYNVSVSMILKSWTHSNYDSPQRPTASNMFLGRVLTPEIIKGTSLWAIHELWDGFGQRCQIPRCTSELTENQHCATLQTPLVTFMVIPHFTQRLFVFICLYVHVCRNICIYSMDIISYIYICIICIITIVLIVIYYKLLWTWYCTVQLSQTGSSTKTGGFTEFTVSPTRSFHSSHSASYGSHSLCHNEHLDFLCRWEPCQE